MKDESFQNWVEGRATPEEADYWDQWIMQSDDNRKLVLEAQNRILGLSFRKKSGERAEESWQRFEKMISKPHIETNSGQGAVFQQPLTPLLRKKTNFGWILRAAAIAIVVLSGSLIWNNLTNMMDAETAPLMAEEMVYQTIETKYGEQKELQLFDGSHIILNANSLLRYGRSLSDRNRIQIELEGEAFFSVTSRDHTDFNDENDVFQVFTKDGVVKVLGTRFSVSSHNDRTIVVLEEGSVAVAAGESADSINGNEAEQWILYPNELAEFSRGNEGLIRKEVVNTRIYTSWKDSRLFFENVPVREIIHRFEQTFGIPFNVSDVTLLDRTVSGSVENSELKVMAQIFSEILNVSVEVYDEQVLITNI